jgi:hypothetical protein
MNPMLSDVGILAGKIGPRGTGTPGERAAADYVAERLLAFALPVERQVFQAVTSQNAFALAIAMISLLAFVLYPLGGALSRWIAAGLALSAAPMLWQTIRTSKNPLRPFLPKAQSRNVLARIEPRGEILQRVVLLAHLDTNRCRLIWQSSAVRSLEPLTYLTLGMLASLGVLYLAGALLGGPEWLWWASFLPAAYAAGMIITLLKDDRVPFSCGAHDNAASVAVALEIGERLTAKPLYATQVWLAFTGAEETDHAGLYALLHKHGSTLRGAVFIGLEGLGSGEICYLTKQGLCAHYRPDEATLSLAIRAASHHPELGVKSGEMLMEDETGTLRRAGYRAMCIAGRDRATGTLPHWHRADDTVDTISIPVMEGAAKYVLALLEELDTCVLL